jgi:hypothetical protein
MKSRLHRRLVGRLEVDWVDQSQKEKGEGPRSLEGRENNDRGILREGSTYVLVGT